MDEDTTYDSSLWLIGGIPSPTLAWGQTWGGVRHECRYCGLILLTGEKAGFCCGNRGSHLHDVAPLPPLPPSYQTICNHPQISTLSRKLNLIFSFASMESSHAFPSQTANGMVAVQGKVYHRVRPEHENSSIRWILYDSSMQDIPHHLPHEAIAQQLPVQIIQSFWNALVSVNPLVSALRLLASINPSQLPNAQLILHDAGLTNEIAAIMSFDNTTQHGIRPRRIIITRTSGTEQYVPNYSRLWEPLSYPLLFPHGTLGWGRQGSMSDIDNRQQNTGTDGVDSPSSQIWHYRARLLREERFNIFGRLTNEYVVDMFSRSLESRLYYIRMNQERLRREDAALMGIDDIAPNENVYLPVSFLGSARWAAEQVADSLAVAGSLGSPTFFITVTCNANWIEIQSQLLPGQHVLDRPVLICRVFKRKLSLLIKCLHSMFTNAGSLVYIVCSVEFQKRGLPHAHLLVKYHADCADPRHIDSIISAEMPTDPSDRQLVQSFMVHHHVVHGNQYSRYCIREDRAGRRWCRFSYPKPIQTHTTIDAEGRVQYRRRHNADCWVVPHCLPLLRKFRCHMNFEAASSSHLFQYLFKYIHKGKFLSQIVSSIIVLTVL